MVGAGIFALLGEATALAGSAVWVSFLMAGVVALLTGYSFVQMGIHSSTSTNSAAIASGITMSIDPERLRQKVPYIAVYSRYWSDPNTLE